MNKTVARVAAESAKVPALFAPTAPAGKRYVEFFTANIRNPNTRKAYARAANEFAAWCDSVGLHELIDLEAVHLAAYVETLQARLSPPSVKLENYIAEPLKIENGCAVAPERPGHGISTGRAWHRCRRKERMRRWSRPAGTPPARRMCHDRRPRGGSLC